MATYETLILKKEPPLAWIILNRPKANAINQKLIDELDKALDELWFDKDARVVIITGSGDRFFSAGADLKEPLPLTLAQTKGAAQVSAMLETAMYMARVTQKIERFPKIVIAAINGFALGGGCELAIACDFRIAAEDAQIGQPELQRGIIPGWGGTQRLVRLIGLAKAKELCLVAEPISAQEAYRIGLVNKVVPREKFEEEVKAFAMKLAQGPPVAQRVTKYALNFGAEAPLGTGLILEGALASIASASKDAMEGVMAFLEKRSPQFKGE
ncbi:MAG: enoyl-CoA hydratase-related protein [Candidatus Jordarchaeales archaeon]|nr:enoyl-CoA hydratase/isomerase family protein [Candidatus Jordarchaeia archaeon]